MRTYHPRNVLRHFAGRSDIPDHATSMADARIALCIASGVALEDIDPASGYDRSRHSYDRVRSSWIDSMRQHGISPYYDVPRMEKVYTRWAEKRPEFTAGDDWLTAGREAHAEFVKGHGHPCRVSDCVVHALTDYEAQLVDELLELLGIEGTSR
ncbi:hypothetical protein [Streptomyces luteireticuli]|uniref:hypothetical protein n=1 Tax=Streptomyces luteireticuli TaxID=173858 RepID=UPI0035591A27